MLLDSFALSVSDIFSQAGLLAAVVLGLETLFRTWTDHWITELSCCFTFLLYTPDLWPFYGIQAKISCAENRLIREYIEDDEITALKIQYIHVYTCYKHKHVFQ